MDYGSAELAELARDEGYQALLRGNEERGDVVRAMAADDYAAERLSGEPQAVYWLVAQAVDAWRLRGPVPDYGAGWVACPAFEARLRVAAEMGDQGRTMPLFFVYGLTVRPGRRESIHYNLVAGQTIAECVPQLVWHYNRLRKDWGVECET